MVCVDLYPTSHSAGTVWRLYDADLWGQDQHGVERKTHLCSTCQTGVIWRSFPNRWRGKHSSYNDCVYETAIVCENKIFGHVKFRFYWWQVHIGISRPRFTSSSMILVIILYWVEDSKQIYIHYYDPKRYFKIHLPDICYERGEIFLIDNSVKMTYLFQLYSINTKILNCWCFTESHRFITSLTIDWG